jgi:23S rRNA (uracil1939-C5)-methyltransferase
VIVNPPRAGVDARVIEALVAQPPARILYISCDPATLARDVSRLSPRYHIDSVRGFDLFPQTAHVETVVELACATS